jgi:hypothetical protein
MTAEIIPSGASSRRRAASAMQMRVLVPPEDAIHCVLGRRTYEVTFHPDFIRARTVTQCWRRGSLVLYRRESKLDPLHLLREAKAFVFPLNRGKLLAELEETRAARVTDLDGISRVFAAHEATASAGRRR